MAAPAWATNLTDIYVGGAGTFTALGGGAAGLNTETDYFIIDSDCKSKNAWTNAIKGLIHNHGSSFTVPTTGAIIQFLYYAAINSLEVTEPGGSPSNGGLMFVEGSGSGDYNRYNMAGSDTLLFNSWVPYVVDPNTATPSDTVGTPSGTEQWVGMEANLPTTAGPSKGSPAAVGMSRYGRCDVEYTDGDLGNGYNTFDGAEGWANASTRRLGLIEPVPGTLNMFYVQGFHSFGVSGTAVDFRDSDKVILVRDTPFVAAGFNRFEELNSGSNVDLTNIIFQALGTQSPGTWVVTAGTFDAIACQWFDFGTFTFLSTSSITASVFDGCGQITAPGTAMTGSKVSGYEGTAGTAAVVWNVATDPSGKLDDMIFEKGTAATHAIEFGASTPSSITVNGWDVTGYNAANGNNDSTFYNNSGGALTINVVGGTGNFSYRNGAGASTTIVINPVLLQLHAVDEQGANVASARAFVRAGDAGPMPYLASVGITRVSGTATVAHTAHGLSNGDKVIIEGCNETEYNGVQTISNVSANAYDYTVAGAPATPATGAPISTAVIIDELTTAGGIADDTRTYTADQEIDSTRSHIRKTGASPFYKTAPVAGTVDKDSGLQLQILMLSDE